MISLPLDISGLPILSFRAKSRNLLILVGLFTALPDTNLTVAGSISLPFRNNERCLHFGRHDRTPNAANERSFTIAAKKFALFDFRSDRRSWSRHRLI